MTIHGTPCFEVFYSQISMSTHYIWGSGEDNDECQYLREGTVGAAPAEPTWTRDVGIVSAYSSQDEATLKKDI